MKFSFASRQLEKLRMCVHFAFQFFYEIGFWMLQFPNALKEAWIDISAQRTIFLLCSFPPELIEKVLQLIFSIHLCCITNPKHNSIGCANIQCFTTHKSKGLKVSQTRDFPPKNKFLLSWKVRCSDALIKPVRLDNWPQQLHSTKSPKRVPWYRTWDFTTLSH